MELAALVLTLLWAGLLIGVSFVATPAKFGAASLSLPVALDVGRTTFHLLVMIEWAAFAAYAATVLARRLPRVPTVGGLVLGASLLAQTVWLLPLLDERVATIIAGGVPPPSGLHVIYIALEALNVLVLAGLAWTSLRRLGLVGALRAGEPEWSPSALPARQSRGPS
jgi:hypothetical protein